MVTEMDLLSDLGIAAGAVALFGLVVMAPVAFKIDPVMFLIKRFLVTRAVTFPKPAQLFRPFSCPF